MTDRPEREPESEAAHEARSRPGLAQHVSPSRPAFVLHEHRRPRHHFDLRLEEHGVLRSWAVPRGLPVDPAVNRLAVAVPDHDMDHLTYTDEDKSIADIGWWEEHDRTDRRILFRPKIAGTSLVGMLLSQRKQFKDRHTIVLSRDQVTGVRTEKHFISHWIYVTTADGIEWGFIRGVMSPDPVMAVLQSR